MPVFLPSIIPPEVRSSLLTQVLRETEKSKHEHLKAWEYVGPGERTTEYLEEDIQNWIEDLIVTCNRIFMDWLQKNTPQLTESDVDRTERQIREIGKELISWALGHFDDYEHLVCPSKDDVRKAKHEIVKSAEAFIDGWNDDFLDYAREHRAARASTAAEHDKPPDAVDDATARKLFFKLLGIKYDRSRWASEKNNKITLVSEHLTLRMIFKRVREIQVRNPPERQPINDGVVCVKCRQSVKKHFSGTEECPDCYMKRVEAEYDDKAHRGVVCHSPLTS